MDHEAAAHNARSAQDDGKSPFAPMDSQPGVVIPDHRLLRCIGRGSYGSVWLAQNMMGMYRAVKIVRRQSFEHHRPFERELSGILKFEPISRSHEGFVDVLHVGIRDQDYLYYIMELGDDETTGQSIVPGSYSPKTLGREISAHGKLTFEQCLKLGLAVSDALAELHKHGLVHRDIKPSNIIFVNDTAKLADIGLVASLEEARSYVGTEGFIPPEGPGTPAGDVYSLGKVLYEASTGKDRHEFPDLPTLLYDLPEREKFLELNEIVLRACHSDPKQRYQSAVEMHSDLVVLANGQSVKRLRFLERRFAWLKRIAGVATLVSIAGAIILYFVYHAYIEAQRRQIEAYVALGTRSVQSGDFLGALPYFAGAAKLDTDKTSRTDDRLRFASTLAQCPKLVQMWASSNRMDSVQFDSTGERLLAVGFEGAARLFDVKSGDAVSAAVGDRVESAALSPDGKFIATGSLSPNTDLWTLDGRKLKTFAVGPVTMVSFSPDGKELLIAGYDNTASVWDIQSGTCRVSLTSPRLPGLPFGLLAARFSHDGNRIATGGRDGTVRIWDAATGRQIGPVFTHPTWVNDVAFSPDDRQLATGCFDHYAHLWDLSLGREIFPALSHEDGVWHVQFSPDGRFLLTATLDRMARLWVAANHQLATVNPILKHGDRIRGATIAPNGHQIATACFDGVVRVWELADGQVASIPSYCKFTDDGSRFVNTAESKPVICDTMTGKPVSADLDFGFQPRDFKLSFDGKFIFAASIPEGPDHTSQRLAVLDTATGRAVGPQFTASLCKRLFVSRDGKRVLITHRKEFQIWNAQTGLALSPPIEETNVFILFSPDASKVVTWSGRRVRMRDVMSGKEIFPGFTLDNLVQQVEFNSDGSRFVTCCSDSTLAKCSARIWDATTGRQIGATLQHDDGVLCAAFSPDGKRVATGSEDYTAMIWDARTGKQMTPALRHADQITGIAFSPDNRWVATVGKDRTARIWNAETGDPLTPPLLHAGFPKGVRFLSDGRHLLVRGRDGEGRVWNLSVDERPAEELKKLADVLSSGTVVLSLNAPARQPWELKQHWMELQAAYPDQFSGSPGQVALWDDYQASRCEADRDWFGAQIHLDRLLAMKPGDATLIGRVERVRKKIEAAAMAVER